MSQGRGGRADGSGDPPSVTHRSSEGRAADEVGRPGWETVGRSDSERDAGDEAALGSSGVGGAGGVEDAVEAEEREAVWAAWRSLSDESRSLLWRLVVHEENPRQIAPALGTTASGVATQSKQARVRLRQALLAEVVTHATDPQCREMRRHLGGHVRDSLSAATRQRVEDHLDGCARCRAAVADVVDVDAAIRLRVAPALLPGAFAPPEAAVGASARPTVEEASVPLAVGDASIMGPSGDPLTSVAVGRDEESLAWGTAGRVLSVPGRSAAAVLAAAALVAAVALFLFLFQLEPTGRVTADSPGRPGSSTGSVDGTESPYPTDATGSVAGPRPVIGVAAAEGVSRYQTSSGRSTGSGDAGGPGSLSQQGRPTTGTDSATSTAGGRAPGTTPAPTSPATPSAPVPATSLPGTVGTVGAVTSLRLAPSDRGYLAHLEVPTGWLITSVRDVRGGRPREQVSSPTSVYDGRLAGGDLVVEVTRVRPDLMGALTALFTDRSGAPLPGSGDYPLR